MLESIGNGSCFNTEAGNNSFYYKNKKDDSILLIDCGESIFERIRKNRILEGIKSIDILITHLHSDHVGSLPSLIFACEFLYNIKPNIIYPDKDVMSTYLLGISGNNKDSFNILNDKEYKKYEIQSIKQEHADTINAYGYLIEIDGKTIYYSGDTHTVNPAILQRLNNGQIDYFYQDVTRYENSVHMNINTLNELVDEKYKNRVWCMHFDDDITIKKAKCLGFNCTEPKRCREIEGR